jgi:hypothetical protein
MKKLVMVVSMLMSMLVLGFVGLYAGAGSEGGIEIQKGRRIEPIQVSVTSTTAIEIVVPSVNDIYSCDMSIVNNTDYILWISSWNGVTKSNGFPVLPRKHYSPEGITIADIWAIFDDTMSGTAKVYINKFLSR